MALDDGDKAIVKEIAREVGDELKGQIGRAMNDTVALHAASCRAAHRVDAYENQARGAKALVKVLWTALSFGGGAGLMALVDSIARASGH